MCVSVNGKRKEYLCTGALSFKCLLRYEGMERRERESRQAKGVFENGLVFMREEGQRWSSLVFLGSDSQFYLLFCCCL